MDRCTSTSVHGDQAEFETSRTEGIGAEMVNTPKTVDESSVDKSVSLVSVPLEGVPNITKMSQANGDPLTLTGGNNPPEDESTMHEVSVIIALEEDDIG